MLLFFLHIINPEFVLYHRSLSTSQKNMLEQLRDKSSHYSPPPSQIASLHQYHNTHTGRGTRGSEYMIIDLFHSQILTCITWVHKLCIMAKPTDLDLLRKNAAQSRIKAAVTSRHERNDEGTFRCCVFIDACNKCWQKML